VTHRKQEDGLLQRHELEGVLCCGVLPGNQAEGRRRVRTGDVRQNGRAEEGLRKGDEEKSYGALQRLIGAEKVTRGLSSIIGRHAKRRTSVVLASKRAQGKI
jgi:hypothetical protein